MKKAGIDSRDVGVRFLNEAAPELYMQCDMPGSLMEAVFKVNGDQTVSLPYNIGTIRAVRELASMQVWHINQMRPRYNQFNWPDMWRNYRLRNRQALMATVTNQSVGVITVPFVETPNIVVSVTGPTAVATSISEDLTISATTIYTKNQFLDYTAVKKNCVNTCDVTLSQIDGKLLTVIPNTEIEAEYQIIDISTCPWLPQNTSVLDNYVEILYKRKLNYLFNDDDEFPAFDYDNVVVNKMMQLYNEEQNKVDIAAAYDTKATRTAARLQEDQNRETEDMVALVANPHDTVLKRVRAGWRRYYWYSGRKY